MIVLKTNKLNLNILNIFLILNKNIFTYNNWRNVHIFYDLEIGHIVLLQYFYYDIFTIRKQFFIGVCISIEKKKNTSNFVLRNVLGGLLITQKILLYQPKLYIIRTSGTRKLNVHKAKLYYLLDLPFLFRINKVVLPEFQKNFKKKNKKKLK